MQWKQFFTPVSSITTAEARKFVAGDSAADVVFLDVRQPKEYERGHIPGAKLIPMGELEKRLGELDPAEKTVVYCAIGGRSRAAVQMLSGKGFTNLYNLNGGIKAWNSEIAVGPPELGLELFTGAENAEKTIIIGFGLEEGLKEFYLSMAQRVSKSDAAALFHKLADIEILHQKQLLALHHDMTGQALTMEEFSAKDVRPAMEGGLTTEAYLSLYNPDLDSLQDILGLAMSIEGQALDLYQRAAILSKKSDVQTTLQKIANEERSHIARLAEYIDTI